MYRVLRVPSSQCLKVKKYSTVSSLLHKIHEANQEAVNRIVESDPVLLDVRPAKEVIPILSTSKKVILHSGSPLTWSEMSGGMKGAMIGMALFEKWAQTKEEAEELLVSGEVTFQSAHHHNACGPLAGTISANCPVWCVENKTYGNKAFSRPAEPHQGFGQYTVLDKLNYLTEVIMPAISQGLRQKGGIRMNPQIQRALDLGDEFHVRNMALSCLIINELVVGMIESGVPTKTIADVMNYFDPQYWVQFFGPGACVGLNMATSKSIMDSARNIEYCTVVTCMSRNGTTWGMNVSAMGEEWFTAPAPLPHINFLPGFSQEVLGADMGGDSSVSEALGLGSNVLVGATALMRRMPHSLKVADTFHMNKQVEKITTGFNPNYQIPILDSKGAATGIDIIKVVKTGITPWHVTGAVHKDMNHKIIGQGLSRAPITAFDQALEAFGKKYHLTKEELLS